MSFSLYAIALLADLLDGYLARRTDSITKLGRKLENEVDSVGVLAAALVAISLRGLPWHFLFLGGARYIFVVIVWTCTKLGVSTRELRHSRFSRGVAAVQVNFLLLALVPFAPDRAIVVLAPMVAGAIVAAFARDLIWVCGGRWISVRT